MVRAMRLTVYPDSSVRLVLPLFVTDTQAMQFLQSKQSWLRGKVAAARERGEKQNVPLTDILLFGERVRLKEYESLKGTGVAVFAGEIRLYLRPQTTEQQKRAVIDDYLRQELSKYLTVRVEYYRNLFGEAPVSWTIRKMKTEWGSCMARKRSLLFNLHLVHKPYELIDYVVVHELCHLQVQNHGPEFKRLLTERMPDWQQRKKKLNE